VFFIMGITLFQERKTERALERCATSRAPPLVVRDGSGADRGPGGVEAI